MFCIDLFFSFLTARRLGETEWDDIRSDVSLLHTVYILDVFLEI
jgi:hypothetical protein